MGADGCPGAWVPEEPVLIRTRLNLAGDSRALSQRWKNDLCDAGER